MALFGKVDEQREGYRAARKSVLAKKAAGDDEAVRQFLATDMLPRVKAYVESLRAIVQYQQTVVEADAQSIDDGFKTSLNLQLSLAAIALVAAVWLLERALDLQLWGTAAA